MGSFDWYPHNPRDFLDGVQGIGPEAIGAYIVVLDLIYARGGQIAADYRFLAGIMGCSTRKAQALVLALVGSGKLMLDDGFLSNKRARNEIQTQAKRARNLAEAGSKGGRNRAEKDAQARENSELGQAELKPALSNRQRQDIDIIPLDKSNGVLPVADVDPMKAFWDAARAYLGKSKAGMIGKWVRDYGQPEVAKAITEAQHARAVDPVPYIEKVLRRTRQTSESVTDGLIC